MKTTKWIFFLYILTCSSCYYKNNENNLGNNFYLLEGDHIQDRMIIFCTAKSNDECFAGIPVLPSRKDSISLYVSKVKSNSNWIIAETINTDKTNGYWIINKKDYTRFKKSEWDNIIQKNIYGPMTKNDFLIKKKDLKILITLH